MLERFRKRSVWVFHLNTGACNGCDIEILDILTPYYDIERLGVKLVGSPKHADALLVTGPLTLQCLDAVKAAYEAMPKEPRVVIAIGACACSGGIFYDSFTVLGGIDKVIPVDIYVPGCPPRPEAILFGIAQAVELVHKRIKREVVQAYEELPKPEINERVLKDLRDIALRYVGYYHRDRIVDMYVKAVKASKSVDELEEKIKEVAEGLRDEREREALLFLHSIYKAMLYKYVYGGGSGGRERE